MDICFFKTHIPKAACIPGLLVIALLTFCCEDPVLQPDERLLVQLLEAGFRLEPTKARIEAVRRLRKRESSSCFEAYHHPTTMFLCLHNFKSTIKAVEAGTVLNKKKWPPGRFWVTTVRGRTLVHVDSRLHDRPVAQKLASIFANFE